MPHGLLNPHKNPAHSLPMVATLRYSCVCANGEVLAINVVFDLRMDDSLIEAAMRQALSDLRLEIDQLVKRPLPAPRLPES